MENQRTILIVLLMVVLVFIWQAWLTEQAVKYRPPAISTPAEPTAVEQPRIRSDDLPTPTVALPAERPKGERVRVVTDLFEVEIDTAQGDLYFVGLRTYPESLEQKDRPFAVLHATATETFIAQVGLLSSTADIKLPNHYQNAVTQFVVEQNEYRMTDDQEVLEVPFVFRDPSGFTLTKTYRFERNKFVIGITQRVDNGSSQEWVGRAYQQFKRTPPVAVNHWGMGVYTYTGGVISTPEKSYEKIPFETLAKQDLNRQVVGGWVAMIQHYFLAAWLPDQKEVNGFFSRKVPNGQPRYLLGLVSRDQTIASGSHAEFKSRLYVGPKLQDQLAELAPHLNLTVDYGIFTVIAQPLFWLLKMFYWMVGNWGWAIILLTVLIKAAFYKLSETSYRSMANMRRVMPEMTRLKERYGHDKQRMNQELMTLYQREKINPFGGCLPILIQIPVFIALYWVLLESVELRQSPFMFWIQDLSVKDPLYILPLIMGVTMFIQQKLSPPPPDPMQANVMMILPIIFTFFFLWFPAGLVLYWVVNNILSIAQQYVITRQVEGDTSTQKA